MIFPSVHVMAGVPGCDENVMAPEVSSYQFDNVEVRPRAFQVLRKGVPLGLEPKAVRVLLYLIENRGRAVPKEELLSAVWGDTAVTDNALTRVVAQLRRELGDDARQARYIQTVPTLGYRFVAEVGDLREAEVVRPVPPAKETRRWSPIMGGLVLVIVIAAAAWTLRAPARQPAPTLASTRQLTTSAGFDFSASFSPDGQNIAYSSDRTGRFEVYLRPVDGGGSEVQITNDSGQNIQPAWSPDGKSIAYHSALNGGIWIVPASGGPARQVTTNGSQPAWSPDSSRLAYRTGNVFSVAANDLLSGERSNLFVVPATGGTPGRFPIREHPPVGIPSLRGAPMGDAFSSRRIPAAQPSSGCPIRLAGIPSVLPLSSAACSCTPCTALAAMQSTSVHCQKRGTSGSGAFRSRRVVRRPRASPRKSSGRA